MYKSTLLALLTATLVRGQAGCPPPAQELLTTTKSGVLPILPTPFSGVETLEGAIIAKAPPNASYTPVNGPAPTQSNPAGATYQAVLPATNFDDCTGSTITGSIEVASAPGAVGVSITVDFEGFPDFTTYGPFLYHIHNLPVPADGNCTATLGHLDPQNGGEYYPCIPSAPQNCQVGDLAGKFGSITATPFTAQLTDSFISTVAGNAASVAGKSIVIHTGVNATRLTCANFNLVSGNTNGSAPNASAPAVPSASVIPSSEAAQIVGYGSAALVVIAAAFFL